MVSGPSRDNVKDENALYVFNRLVRMAGETELSTWKQNQVRNFMKHHQIDEILTLTDSFGRTILDNACAAGNLRLVQLLWPKGAKLGKPHVTMTIVCSEHHMAILDYMLGHDPKLATCEVVVGHDDDDETERMPLLNFCAKKGDESVLGILLAYSFKTPESIVKSVDPAGNTPLHVVRKEKAAAMLLNRTGLDVLGKPNLRGQLPVDCLIERFNAMPSMGLGYGMVPTPVECKEELKKTISFMNTLMKHLPSRKRTPSPPLIRENLAASLRSSEGLPQMPPISSVLRQGSHGSRNSPVLGRELLSNSLARNRVLLQEQKDILSSEVAVLQRQRLLDLQDTNREQDHLLALKESINAATRAAQHLPLGTGSLPPSPSSALRLPLTTPRSPVASVHGGNHQRYVDAIDAAFATEVGSSTGVSPSLAMLATALSNKTQKSSLLPGAEDFRLRAAAATTKSLYPQRFEDNEVHKLLRAKYC